ncbi:Cloroperoxidase [Athelia psychrophila]|uniref:Cloroperoxidase n=1 Tax=Athelia psychrophila TaxID=1759441 RepID=A0A166R4Z7_9AGAM|nr:Cloroperoxidase [Fibularhizoctonia sp. CBS 109695]
MEGHTWKAAKSGDSRAPCPALNSLANHGFLPRNGKNLGFFQIVGALREVYNLSIPFAVLLTIVGILFCGHGLQLDLSDLAVHNKIEHDASFAHGDAMPGAKFAPISVDPKRFRHFLSYAALNKGLFIEDMVKARVDYQQLSKPLDNLHAQIAQGEVALAWMTMKDASGKISIDTLKQWWGDERLPEGYQRPAQVVGLLETRNKANAVGSAMKKMTY